MAFKMKSLQVQDFTLGQPIQQDVYDNDAALLLRKGFVIERFEQIEKIMMNGMNFMSIEEQKTGDEEDGLHLYMQAPGLPPKFNPFRLWEHIRTKATDLLQQISTKKGFPEKIQAIAALIQLLSEKDADSGLGLMLRAENARYATAHTVHVALIVELVARRMGWPVEQRKSAVCAALTMNVGMTELYAELFHQRGPLTQEQKTGIIEHPHTGHALLKAAGVQDEAWLTAVLQHHEVHDGKGYPHKLQEVSQMAELLRMADIFCAKVSPRAYRKPIPAGRVIKDMFAEEGRAGKNPIPAMFIKEIGLFPPGSFVQLANEETAIVVRRGQSPTTPIVFSLLSDTNMRYIEPHRRDTAHKDFAIASVVPCEKITVRIDAPRLWGY